MKILFVLAVGGIIFFLWWIMDRDQKRGAPKKGLGNVAGECMEISMRKAIEFLPESDVTKFKSWWRENIEKIVITDENNWSAYIENLSPEDCYYPCEETKRFLYGYKAFRSGPECLAMLALAHYCHGINYSISPRAEIRFYESYWSVIPEPVFKFFNMDKYEYEKSIISQTGVIKLSDRNY